MKLILADHLVLPIEAATQTFLVVGKRGSGKTSTAVRLAEQFAHAGVPFVVLDPADVWWGLKASKDGKHPGLAVYVFGGRHGDLPLEPTAGALMADVVMEHRLPVVLSIKHFSGGERTRFVTEFASRLYRQNTEPLHLFLEEAHEVAPQHPYKGEEPMLGAMQRIWKLGRSSGLGGSAITQRPASLNKNITTQAEVLIVHRTIGPQDVAAIREWIKYHGEREDVLAELATLKTGEAFIWAPDFPERHPIGLKRVSILERDTFDSSATPKAGEHRTEPNMLAPVDLERLRTKMAATIERAKAEDPRELRRRIVELESILAKANIAAERIDTKLDRVQIREKRVEIPVLKDAHLKGIEKALMHLERHKEAAAGYIQAFDHARASLSQAASDLMRAVNAIRYPVAASPAEPSRSHAILADRKAPVHAEAVGEGSNTLGAGERKILTAIAQYAHGATREQLTVLTGYRRSSRDTYVQRLRHAHYVTLSGGLLLATQAGIAELGSDFTPLPTGQALRFYWLSTLPEGERAIFEIIIAFYPNPIDRETISERTSYKRSSRDTYLQRLRTRQLVEIMGQGQVKASDELFDE